MENIFFESWQSLLRIAINTVLAYVAIVFILRITGKRTLSKMNAFDFIITIALGSSLAAVSLNKSVPLVDGIFVFFIIILLQYLLTWLSVRIKSFKNIITAKPSLLLYKGEIIEEAMKKERILMEEIYAAARENGISSLKEVDAIILETTGELTILAM